MQQIICKRDPSCGHSVIKRSAMAKNAKKIKKPAESKAEAVKAASPSLSYGKYRPVYHSKED